MKIKMQKTVTLTSAQIIGAEGYQRHLGNKMTLKDFVKHQIFLNGVNNTLGLFEKFYDIEMSD